MLPESVPVLSSVIFEDLLTPKLFRAYVRLYALAWRNNYQFTDRLYFGDLAERLGVSVPQARRILRELKLARLITWDSDGGHGYVVHFVSGGAAGAAGADQGQGPELDTAVILDATRDLFGERVSGSASRYDAAVLLAAVAEVHSEGKYTYPARVVYNRLRKGQQPDKRFYNYVDYLPDWFLIRVGLLEEEPEDESLVAEVATRNRREENRAWAWVLDQLKMDMPKAAYDKYVRDSRVVSDDGESLVVQVDSVEWCDSRLRPTACKILLGVGRPGGVVFVEVEDGGE